MTEDISGQNTPGGNRIALVLGSGGARGLAHIGVIRELERRGYQIEAIAGCSMGALVGGLHAVGKLDEYAKWVSSLERSDLLALLDVTTGRGGFIGGQKIMEKLGEWLGDIRIEQLDLDYTAVAVDIQREKEVWMSEGSLFDAIRASIAIPGVFTPHEYLGRVLVDGGVLNPIPVAPAVSTLTDQTFVVDANGPPTDYFHRSELKGQGAGETRFIDKVLSLLKGKEKSRAAARDEMDVARVMLRSLDTMQAALTRQHLAVFHPDVIFRVPRNACMIHEFHRARELIDLGGQVARQSLDDPAFERRQAP